MNTTYQFYCLSHNNKQKRRTMEEKFNKLNIDCQFYNGIQDNDSRISYYSNLFNRRQKSITYSHLDIIRDFYFKSDKDYAIICEDDILINKHIVFILDKLIKDFEKMKLNILLLGYMLPYKLERCHVHSEYSIKLPKISDSYYTYHNYPEYLSGTQMYMITKVYAKYILDYYDNCILLDKYHLMDKLFIKDGNRALIYPMIAIEDEKQKDGYHLFCHKTHYNEFFI